MKPKIYLAGPEVFFPDPQAASANRKEICAKYGIEGCFPMDGNFPKVSSSMTQARSIYLGDIGLLDECDAVIANMVPFRGVSMDVGTAYEMGYGAAKGKPLFGWSKEHARDYATRVAESKIDDGMHVEGYNLADNLMVVIPLHDGIVHKTFEEAAEAAGKALVK